MFTAESVNPEVLLFSVTLVTFVPITALIVVVPAPVPEFVIVPVLFRLVPLKVIVPLVSLLITQLLVPVTPPVNVAETPVPVVPTVSVPVSLLANTIALLMVRPVVLTNKLAAVLPPLIPSATVPEPSAEPELDTVNVPPAMVVVPEYPLLLPDKVSAPAVSVRPLALVPVIAPLYVPLALLKVSVFAPSAKTPAPLKVVMVAPLVVLLISKVPASATPLLLAIEPEPDRLKVPAVIVVAPV